MKRYLQYCIGDDIEAFTVGKDTPLPYHVIQPHQIHGDNIATINDKTTKREDLEGIDALITNIRDCPIAVRTADCVPILIYDPVQKAIAAVHSGWRGTVKGIVKKTIYKMSQEYGTEPADIIAVIGPSIGPKHFSVHDDVRLAFHLAQFPMNEICKRLKGRSYLIDLWRANSWLLKQAGVKSTNIQTTGICTYAHQDEFYSARYEKNNKCGRNINVIRIKNKCEV